MSQLTYSIAPARAFAGLIAHVQTAEDIISSVNSEASAEIEFGCFVKSGTAERTSLLLSASTDIIQGVVVHRTWYERTLDLGTTGVKAGRRLDIMRRGRIWVPCETAMALTASVFVRYAGTGNKGEVRNAAVTNETIDIHTIAKPNTVLSAAGLVCLDIDCVNF